MTIELTGTAPGADGLTPGALARAFRAWVASNRAALAPLLDRGDASFDERVDLLLELQRLLFDAGWARLGWPTELGGTGGSGLLRAALVEAIEDAGFPPRLILEHLEIIAPALARFAPPKLAADLLPRSLRGDVLWCQGFSEPTAGSDLASLRTRAERAPGGFRLRGHKIWTSWAKWATHSTVLARTGSSEDRHRALTMFAVELESPGLTANIIRQANGTEEFAEVFLDDVFVAEDRVIGEVDGGWEVAMYLLSCERGAFAWQRHLGLYPRLAEAARCARDDTEARALGEAAAELFAVRVRAWSTMRELADGGAPGPEAAVNKVLITDAERRVYDTIGDVLGSSLELGSIHHAARWQEDWMFARATAIYGGTRQIQLNVIANHLLRRGEARGSEDYAAFHDGILEALRSADDVRDALDGLDWWGSAGPEASGDGRLALGALFEAQGRLLQCSPALGSLLAHPVLCAAGSAAGLRGAAAVHAEAVGGGRHALWLLPGAQDAERCAVWLPGSSASAGADSVGGAGGSAAVVAIEHLEFGPSPGIDAGWLGRAEVESSKLVAVEVPRQARERALAEARVAAAFEVLGACEAIFAAVVEHAGAREQFGQPIARFQAVQHLLAEAHVARTALREAAALALGRLCAGALDPELAALIKVLAGRCGRTVAQHGLQVLGAVGFTDEHPHNHRSRRIWMLDGVLGTSRGLAREIGLRILAEHRVPRGPDVEDLPGAGAC